MDKIVQQLVKFFNQSISYSELSQELRDHMYDTFVSEMPYGTAKARSGDPDEWLEQKLETLLETEHKSFVEQTCIAVYNKYFV